MSSHYNLRDPAWRVVTDLTRAGLKNFSRTILARSASWWLRRRRTSTLYLDRWSRISSRGAVGHCRRRSTRLRWSSTPGSLSDGPISSTSCNGCSTGASIVSSTRGLIACRATRLDIALRPARFADETRPASILTCCVGRRGMRACATATARMCRLLRLEPLLIGSIFPIHGEDRIVVTPQEVAALLPAALTTVEDRKFYTHHGVDPVGIARALWVNVRARTDRAGRQYADPAARQELFPRFARRLGTQAARGRHGAVARRAFQQGGSHERLHQ